LESKLGARDRTQRSICDRKRALIYNTVARWLFTRETEIRFGIQK
jgi:hypothetical protein